MESTPTPTDPRYKKTGNVEGEPIVLNGLTFIVPALNFRQVRQLRQKLTELRIPTAGASLGMGDEEMLDRFFEVIHAALSRNYSNLQLEDMDELVDLRNLVPVITAVMNVSGLVRLGEQMGALGPAPETMPTGT